MLEDNGPTLERKQHVKVSRQILFFLHACFWRENVSRQTVDIGRQRQVYVRHSNKRPIGYIIHLRKPFESINTYGYIITLIKRWKKTIMIFMRIKLFFICTNLNPLHLKILCAKFGWNWPDGSGEEDFLISSMYFCYFVIISPWKRRGFSFEQSWIPFTQACFVRSLVEIRWVVLEKKILKLRQCIFAISWLYPLRNEQIPSFEHNLIPFTTDALYQVWVKLTERFWRRSSKCEKLTDGQTDDRQRMIRKAHLSFQLRWA